ncbi:hypothetical protein G3I01_02745 [Gramella sp. MT6]|uniref:energy transducer TonB n=1 Tax=Gramella sp. MT6 TaxID=2705471 RepID=UPI001C5E20DC|nr:energy transducer TonB [Gramella sp. MT6]QYA24471.1 hypothetical protein G3I01_02745 [Gramella sp. MT6]
MKNLNTSLILSFFLSLLSLSGFCQEKEDSFEGDAIPFAVVDEAPAYPGCENLKGDQLKDCTVENITNHVNTNFNTGLGKKLNIEGRTRIIVQFKIDENGEVHKVRSRSLADDSKKREALQNEANRVIKNLPKMKPAQMEGKNVAIMYSLPIEFAVPEKETKKG